MFKKITTGFLFLCINYAAYAQNNNQASLLKLTKHSDSLARKSMPEKLYIQFDKQGYVQGDTTWFKAYLFNAPSLLLSAQSGILHIDIATDSNKVIKQCIFPVSRGVAWGDIPLNEKDFKAGDYTLRAYTNWMRNFPADVFFYKHFRIVGAGENNWLITGKITADTASHIRAQLQLTDMNKAPVADSLLQLRIADGKKSLYKQAVKTDKKGFVDVNFVLPPKTVRPQIRIENIGKTHKAVVPIITGTTGNIDLQFMPEGGGLIAGLNTKVAFKAIGEDGRGRDVSGIIVDKAGKRVASFAATHNGTGSFNMLPQVGEIYTARINAPGATAKDYPLPAIKAAGTSLHLENLMESDSIGVTISATGDLARSGTQYFLIAKARGVVCYAAAFNFEKGVIVRHQIAKSLFPSGITHFILTTSEGEPLNERVVFINHHDDLHVNIEPGQMVYSAKDSIALHLDVTSATGQPVSGNFSLAVTDDAQVRADTSNNIVTRALLTSDLNGYVADPAWYLRNDTSAWKALDNLLLTQGWVSYEPTNAVMPFAAEKEYTVSGKVNNVFGAALKRSPIVLFSRSPTILMDTVTNNQGRFIFNQFPRVDTAVFILQARTRHGRSFNVNIDMNEFVPPVFNAPNAPASQPWYVNTDTTLMNRVKNNIQMRQQEYNPGGGRMLKEVKIIAKKTVKGTQNLNGPGNADIVVDEKELEAAGKKTFLQLFQERIKGFRESYFPAPNWLSKRDLKEVLEFEKNYITHGGDGAWYFIYDRPVILIIDGIDIEDLFPEFNFHDFMSYLKSHSAEDIKGIEVNISPQYYNNYLRMGKWMAAPLMERSVREFAFIEVTTRYGHSALIKNTPGVYLYKPLALSWPKQFYKPKYTVNDTSHVADLRSTIDWEPNINTDSTGRAIITFYAGTEPRTYTIIAEGTDLNGNVGTTRRKLTIGKRKTPSKSK
jgi:hypothetical protein